MGALVQFAIKLAVFSAYTALLVLFLNGISNFVMSYANMNSFMTPTICWFFTQFKVPSLLATFFSFMSANWLKAKVIQYWAGN